ELIVKLEEQARGKLLEAIQTKDKKEREEAISQTKDDILASFEEEGEDVINQVKSIMDDMVKEEVRRLITKEKIRPDGRKNDELRPLSSRVGILPRTHGSGLFTRGQTQALSVDRKSTRLNSSHVSISYAVFCLKKKRTRTKAAKTHTATRRA